MVSFPFNRSDKFQQGFAKYAIIARTTNIRIEPISITDITRQKYALDVFGFTRGFRSMWVSGRFPTGGSKS